MMTEYSTKRIVGVETKRCSNCYCAKLLRAHICFCTGKYCVKFKSRINCFIQETL